MEEEKKGKLHIALLPWLAFGHLNPLLHLAVALADVGLRITYLSTPRNTRRLPLHSIPPHLSSRIHFHNLTLPLVDGLPANAEATLDLTADNQNPPLKLAYDRLQEQVKNFLSSGDAPDHLIYDLLAHWAPSAAAEVSVPCTLFSIFPALTMTFLGLPPEGADTEDEEVARRWWPSPESMTSTPEWIKIPTKVAFRRWEAEGMYSVMFDTCQSGIRGATRYVRTIERSSSGAVAVRCCREFNAEFLDALSDILGMLVIPVGWLPPTVIPRAPQANERRDKMQQWLDGQPAKSVVFVSFGSEYKMDRAALSELALGLELSNVSFLWVIQRPGWLDGDEEDDKALPDGFRSRTEGRGLVSFGWAPQLKILAHESVGATLFHAGWSSVIESLSYGLVLVLLPGVFDQGLIARRLVEKGLGVEVERNEDDGWFNRDGVAVALRTAMASEESEKMREKAEELSATVGDRALHDRYINHFVSFLTKCKK